VAPSRRARGLARDAASLKASAPCTWDTWIALALRRVPGAPPLALLVVAAQGPDWADTLWALAGALSDGAWAGSRANRDGFRTGCPG
jgi:hypothetical protein